MDDVIGKNKVDMLLPTIGLMLVVHLASIVIAALRTNLLEKVGQKVILDLRNRVYRKLQRQSIAYFNNRRTGELMSRTMSDVDVLQEVITRGTDNVLVTWMMFIGVVSAIIYINWKLGLIVLCPLPLIAFLTVKFNRKVRTIYRSAREKLGDVSAKLQENLSGREVVKAFGREEDEAEQFRSYTDTYYDETVRGINARTMFFPAVRFVGFWGNAAMIGFGAWFVLKGEFTIGGLVAYRGFWWYLFGPIDTLASINDLIQRGIAAGRRIFEVLDEEVEIQDAPNAVELHSVEGEVRFEDVSFSYDGENHVLKHISFSALPSETIALAGPSGAGKSTILNLIPRFYDPTGGRITIDGLDIKDLTQRSLRRHIGIVLQETFLFNGTIMENIRYGKPDAGYDEVVRAAEAANAHEFILQMPDGYDTEIGERGVKLSGGQRQRLAIARAFLSDPEILILDEATSSVEPESELIIQHALERLMKGRTTFLTSHRLSMVRNADIIVVIEGGRIMETGDHTSLMEEAGLYYRMYTMQMGQGSALADRVTE